MLIRFFATDSIVGTTLVLGALTASPVAAQEFSADMVRTPAQGSGTTRLFVGSDKVRFQSYENGQPTAGVIWDAGRQTMIIVSDKDRMYIGGNVGALAGTAMNRSGAPAMWHLYRPSNSSDPCADWNAIVQAMPRDSAKPVPHLTCQNMGSDAVNGRAAQKWHVTGTSSDGQAESGDVWIDSRLHLITKSQDRNGTTTLQNIQEGPQPASEFEVPAGYRQLDASALLAQLKGAHAGDSVSLSGLLDGAAKDIGQTAATATTDAAKEKVKKGIRSILHVP